MKKMIHSGGVTSLSFAGLALLANEAGAFEVPDEAEDALRAHGFVLEGEATPGPEAAPTGEAIVFTPDEIVRLSEQLDNLTGANAVLELAAASDREALAKKDATIAELSAHVAELEALLATATAPAEIPEANPAPETNPAPAPEAAPTPAPAAAPTPADAPKAKAKKAR